jgi:hypothetical protein
MPVPKNWSENLSNFLAEWERKRTELEYLGDEYIADNPFHHFIAVDPVESWDSFLRWIEELGSDWIYRGQHDASWTFETSLDRGVVRVDSDALWHIDRKNAMTPLVYRFQQYAHTFLTHLPSSDDLSSWYALMQHHCAPTPLLDWTESPFVAMYFAVEEKAEEKRHAQGFCSAVWAINSEWLDKKSQEVLKTKSVPFPLGDPSPTEVAQYKNHLLKGTVAAPCVLRIDPPISNARLFAQRGFFLCKLIDEATIAQLLMSMMMHPVHTKRPVIRKLEIGSGFRIEFLKRLRAMNIHRASLFPGLDGLGYSLKVDLELHD